MASTDRAFRALARSQPGVVLALLRLALPELLPDIRVDSSDVTDPKLDVPPPHEADLVALAGDADLLHVEGQGYREAAFGERIFHYHLVLVLRYPARRVHTVALWLTRPPTSQRLERIERSGVAVDLHAVVLAELPATALLANPDTVCFVPGADAEGRSPLDLCRLAARALSKQKADWQRLLVSAAVAAAAGRYDAMIQAMHEADLEPPIIEDLVRFGRDRGISQGIELGRTQGIELGRTQGERRALFELLQARGLTPSAEQRSLVDSEHDSERLLAWLRLAATATSADEVFAALDQNLEP
jgi:hypothetical protein